MAQRGGHIPAKERVNEHRSDKDNSRTIAILLIAEQSSSDDVNIANARILGRRSNNCSRIGAAFMPHHARAIHNRQHAGGYRVINSTAESVKLRHTQTLRAVSS